MNSLSNAMGYLCAEYMSKVWVERRPRTYSAVKQPAVPPDDPKRVYLHRTSVAVPDVWRTHVSKDANNIMQSIQVASLWVH